MRYTGFAHKKREGLQQKKVTPASLLFKGQGTVLKTVKWLITFRNFLCLENEILKFYDFPGFLWPVRTLQK